MKHEKLKELIEEYILDADNAEKNYRVAMRYNLMGHTASAMSFFLRAAERTDDDLLKYECLIRASLCFDKQGSRGLSVRGLLQHALSINPYRPEAYYFLSRYYEREGSNHPHTNESVEDWFNGYTISSIGWEITNEDNAPLHTNISEYPGKYGILFEKAVCSWWCGLCNESKELLLQLYHNDSIDKRHRNAIINNLGILGVNVK